MEENRFRSKTHNTVCYVCYGLLCFLSPRRLFDYLKLRHKKVQLGVLNRVLKARGHWNSIVFNIKFLEDCLESAVAPKGIQRRVKRSKVHHSALIERSFVKDELSKSRHQELQARNHFRRLYGQAKEFLGFFDFIRFSWMISECDRNQRLALKGKYADCIKRLRQDRYGIVTNDYSNIINLANVELTTIEKEVLCRGVDFGVPPRISEPEILAEFELLQNRLDQFCPISKSSADRSKCELASVAHGFAAVKPDTRNFSLKREHRKVLRDLRSNKDLVVVRPDKGKATVLLTKQDYKAKMMTVLEDQSKFIRLGPCERFDRTIKIEQELQAYLKRLVKTKEISQEQCAAVCPVGSARPRLYGLPKIHKPGVPLRPILSMSASPQYAISRWLCTMLKPVAEYYGGRCVKDSFTFSDMVKTATLSPSGFMCSFDVVSLFTNVPLLEVADICADALYHNDSIETEPTALSEKSFRELLQMVTSGVEFSFGDVMYRQIDGVAMGSPLGPILANIFVGFYEMKIPVNKWPEIYCRFVDDVFSHFESKEACHRFGDQLNSLHPALRFTREDEISGTLPYMDVKVMRSDDRIITSTYRKPTFTGLYTPWDSYSPTTYKINLVRSLAHRARRICSPTMIESELNTLRGIFLRNGYPGHVLDKHLTLCPSNSAPPFIGPKRCPIFIRLPWIGPLSGVFEKRISDAVRLAYYAVQVRVAYRTSRAFSLPKDRLPTPSLSNIIYLFECRPCNSRYVGKTSQHFGERIKQHVPKHLVDPPADGKKRGRGRPPKNLEKPAAERYPSAIACHLAENDECRTNYSVQHFSVLARGRSRQHLDVLEAVFIQQLKPVLCKQKTNVKALHLFRSVSS